MPFSKAFLGAATAFLLASTAAYAEAELTVYTSVEAVDLDRYKETFEKAHPDIKINWVRDSTGVMTAKLLAEKDNPQADVVWGVAATSLLLLKSEGMLEPYAPKNVEALDPRFVDGDKPPSWVGMDAYVAALCYNTVEAEKLGLTPPTSWKDLTKPEYKGHVVMPNPNSSGTGFLDVSAWLQTFGEEEAWSFMDALHENIAAYTHSGSKPCKMAASGETVIGVSFEFPGAKAKTSGAPIDIIFPAEGSGWEAEATAIIAGTANLEAAKTLVDWSITKEANEMYNVGYAVVAYPGVAKPIENLPDDVAEKMIENDFEWAANNRARILKEWQKRYDAKSEPKS
ncbi:putative 2-aminoethylphosphonate ABC transporter substrate-binding protein [Sinorhizobium medicae]|uniref:2-aminoethylphosphonate ABC transporter substrate-binding protein n=1 Tax=Sinorhizobium medicae TaxID=110321 RepID=A0A508X6D3_9HYPH|nr:putative 2-aminoethylphosphonate ABC transporter substrate-binding protein [Sinorhizobium medicae]MBO1941929.1 putative 2-aminoethylphosphonate ABC transporter substrate-binding protein [Sinorhizobium medicae]MBO1960955.1 putative 2-aminoethylphosphonate ABC transporter substrate-binding protein [Sinorhizobium medicae]MDX0456732.1 putative 2-aminoethylphosphonate ABC transporter substrate-binding protein [Sinorhizobium medicae]MDX0517823.1 putative 2-aminoethylphosphonate ABC transporter sub